MWPRKNKICYCKPENLLKKKIVCHIQSLDMHMLSLGFPNGSAGKERIWPMQETQGIGLPSLGQQDSLEKEMAPIAIFLPGKSNAQMSLAGLQRVRHDWMCVRVRVRARAHTHTHTHTCCHCLQEACYYPWDEGLWWVSNASCMRKAEGAWSLIFYIQHGNLAC